MKAWSTIFKVGLLLPCFAVATNEEEFSLVLHLHNGLCLTSECIGCLAFGEPCDPADPRQRWYMDGRAIVNSKFGRCLELAEDNDVLLTDCHGGRSQEWEFDYLRDHLLGELQWVRYLHNMKCMRFQPGKIVYIGTCADEPELQFLKVTEWPHSSNTPKDVASSCCLDQKCPEPQKATDGEEFSLVLDLHKGLCMTHSFTSWYVHGRPCDPADRSQRWYMDGRAIVNSKFWVSACLELDERKHVVSRKCHGGRSQEWEFDYLRDHVLGELQWVRYLQNMKCMRFHPDKNSGLVYIDHLHPDNSGVVYIDTCADVSQAQFLKLTKWPYSRNTPKDVASSCCLDQKCPERSNSSHSDCRCPEGVQSQSDLWFMVPVLLVFCGALGWIWKGSKGDKPTGLEQQVRSKSPHGQAREKKLDTMDATILHNIYSTVTEIAAAIDGQRGSDSSSDCTVGSWTHVTSGQPCCFLPDAYFKVMTDDGEICEKQAKMLFKGTRVIAANGTPIEVLHPPEQHQVDAVIKLQVGSASLLVSPDHRILIPGNKTIQAKHLEEGSEVFLDGTEAKAKLTSFEWNHVPTMVVKIAFKPDIPVAAFMWSPSILSKGSRDKPRVRRGTSTRAPEGGDALTIPDTEPPLTP